MRPSWVEVDLAAIAANVTAIAEAVAPAGVCAVVKADGYGHGDVPVAEAALAAGAPWLAVALVEEGVRLREAGIDAPILVLSEPPAEAVGELLEWELTPTVYRREMVEAVERSAGRRVTVHLKVDTGMHRVGADPDEALSLAKQIAGSQRLELGAIWTHLAVAESDPLGTGRQLDTFDAFLAALAGAGIEVPMVHAANTAGALGYERARFGLVRAGIGIYGLNPDPSFDPKVPLRPAMRLVSHVSLVRRYPAGTRLSYGWRRPLLASATVATVPIGYADGVPRLLGERGGEVLIGGRRRPLAGSVTMDQLVVDCGDDPVAVGDEVVLIGRQGDQGITADEWAARARTINYEIVARIGPRLPRRYRE